MKNRTHSRRDFLKRLAYSSLGLFSGVLFFKTDAACARILCGQVKTKSTSKRLILEMKYVAQSPKPGQKCSNCAQFKQDPIHKNFGQCKILKDCAVDSEGWCKAWS